MLRVSTFTAPQLSTGLRWVNNEAVNELYAVRGEQARAGLESSLREEASQREQTRIAVPVLGG